MVKKKEKENHSLLHLASIAFLHSNQEFQNADCYLYIINSFADKRVEESQHDIPLLPPQETHSPVLLVYPFLHHSAYDNVHTRSHTPFMGCLLHPSHHVLPQYTASSKIIPVHSSILAFREYNVGYKIQCHDFRSVPTWKRL